MKNKQQNRTQCPIIAKLIDDMREHLSADINPTYVKENGIQLGKSEDWSSATKELLKQTGVDKEFYKP